MGPAAAVSVIANMDSAETEPHIVLSGLFLVWMSKVQDEEEICVV